jgi:CBS-domain-containing membrane protein
MRVAEVMSKDVETVSPATSFRDLWQILISKKYNALPVVDATRRLVGIVTKEDLLGSLYPDYREYIEDFASASDFQAMENKLKEMANTKARDVMCRRVIFTREKTLLMRALSRMIARHVNQLPVLSENDRLVGIITKGDVFKSLFQHQLKKILKPKLISRKK